MRRDELVRHLPSRTLLPRPSPKHPHLQVVGEMEQLALRGWKEYWSDGWNKFDVLSLSCMLAAFAIRMTLLLDGGYPAHSLGLGADATDTLNSYFQNLSVLAVTSLILRSLEALSYNKDIGRTSPPLPPPSSSLPPFSRAHPLRLVSPLHPRPPQCSSLPSPPSSRPHPHHSHTPLTHPGELYTIFLSMLSESAAVYIILTCYAVAFGVAFTALLPQSVTRAEVFERPFFATFWALLGDFNLGDSPSDHLQPRLIPFARSNSRGKGWVKMG